MSTTTASITRPKRQDKLNLNGYSEACMTFDIATQQYYHNTIPISRTTAAHLWSVYMQQPQRSDHV